MVGDEAADVAEAERQQLPKLLPLPRCPFRKFRPQLSRPEDVAEEEAGEGVGRLLLAHPRANRTRPTSK